MRPWQNIAVPREILVGYMYLVHAEDRLSKTEGVSLCAGVEVAGPDDRGAGNSSFTILPRIRVGDDEAKKNGSRNQKKCQSGVKG